MVRMGSEQAERGPARVVEREVAVEFVPRRDRGDVLPGAQRRGGHQVSQAQPVRRVAAFEKSRQVAGGEGITGTNRLDDAGHGCGDEYLLAASGVHGGSVTCVLDDNGGGGAE